MQLDDRDVRREKRNRSQDSRAEDRVQLDLLVLGIGERAGLPQQRIGHANLADVVQQRAEPEDLEFCLVQAERPADRDRQHADSFGMAGCVGVARVERRGQARGSRRCTPLRFRLPPPTPRPSDR